MANTTYTYSVTNDTLNGKVSAASLETEILNSSIVIALYEITVDGDNLDLTFKGNLDTAEQATLTGVVAGHDGVDNQIQAMTVKVAEESLDPAKRTGGHYIAFGLNHTVPAGVGSSFTDFTFPFPIAALDFEFIPRANMDGDDVSVEVGPDTIVGAIIAPVAVGDSTFTVSDTVLENADIGFVISLFDGTNTDKVGKVIAKDLVNKTITVTGSASLAFSPATPTYVRISICLVEKIRITGTARLEIGAAKIGASYMPPNTAIRFYYENNEGSAKEFSGILEALY